MRSFAEVLPEFCERIICGALGLIEYTIEIETTVEIAAHIFDCSEVECYGTIVCVGVICWAMQCDDGSACEDGEIEPGGNILIRVRIVCMDAPLECLTCCKTIVVQSEIVLITDAVCHGVVDSGTGCICFQPDCLSVDISHVCDEGNIAIDENTRGCGVGTVNEREKIVNRPK